MQPENGNKERPVDWETKYLQQVEMKKQLQLTIKNLNKQNQIQGSAIEKATNSDEYRVKLKQAQEDLRIWKQKYA